MIRRYAAVLLAVSLTLAGAGFAVSSPSEDAQGKLMTGNKRFVSGALERKNVGDSRRKELAGGQHPFAIVVTCSDSRVAPEIIFDEGLGDIFVIRVAGNVLDPIALGSIEYAAEHLHAPLLVLLGHESCGAVTASMDEKAHVEGNIGEIVKMIRPAVKQAKAKVKNGSKEELLNAAIRENVSLSYKTIQEKSPILKHLIDKGELRVVAGVYHLGTGQIEEITIETSKAAASHKTH